MSYFGLLIGVILIKIAPEEQKPLNKYFQIAKKALLALIFVFLMLFYYNNWFFVLVSTAYIVLLLVIDFNGKDELKKLTVCYTTFGFIFYLSSKNLNFSAIESSLILLYGMPAASLTYNKKEKNQFKIFFCTIGFLIISNLLYLI